MIATASPHHRHSEGLTLDVRTSASACVVEPPPVHRQPLHDHRDRRSRRPPSAPSDGWSPVRGKNVRIKVTGSTYPSQLPMTVNPEPPELSFVEVLLPCDRTV